MEPNRSELVERLERHFNEDELRVMAVRLGADYENLEGGGKQGRVVSLVDLMSRNGRLEELRDLIVAERSFLRTILAPQGADNSIPFVVVAMTAEEAAAMEAESIFEQPLAIRGRSVSVDQVHERFKAMKAELVPRQFSELMARYQEDRDQWRPSPEFPPIQEIIEGMARQRGERAAFRSEELFAPDDATRERTADDLQLTGCVLIVDGLSLFHPWVLNALLDANLIQIDNKVSALVLSPLDSSLHKVNKLIEEEIDARAQLAVVMRRFEERLDLQCEFGLGGLRSLRRWLFFVLPRAAEVVQRQRANSDNLDIFSNSIEQPVTNIGRRITGRR